MISVIVGSLNWKDRGPGWPRQRQDPNSKVTRAKRAGAMAQAVAPQVQTPVSQKEKRVQSVRSATYSGG
jgi:hypothetical protein